MKLADAFKSCEIAKKYMDDNIASGVEFALKIFEQVEPEVPADPPKPKKQAKKVQENKTVAPSPKVYVCEICGKEFKGVGRQKACNDCKNKKQQEEEIRRVANDLARED